MFATVVTQVDVCLDGGVGMNRGAIPTSTKTFGNLHPHPEYQGSLYPLGCISYQPRGPQKPIQERAIRIIEKMSPSVFNEAETQWLAQLQAMRDALAELKLPPELLNGEAPSYGQDIVLSDEIQSDISWSDDVWDDQPGEELNGLSGGVDGVGHGLDWLTTKCVEFASKNPGLATAELQDQILAVMASDTSGMAILFLLE